MLVAPSPKKATPTRGCLRNWNASAAPVIAGEAAADDGVRAEVPLLDVVEVHRAAVAARAALQLAVELRHHRVDVRALGDRVPVRAVRRGDHVVRLERRHHARRDGLLADRDVQEARQLAGAEALLDLLLEAPDQQHLAEKLAETLVRQRARFRAAPPRPCPRPSPSALIMLTSAWELVEQWRSIRSELPEDWGEAKLNLSVAKDEQRARAAALLGPAGPGRLGDELRLSVHRAGGGIGPDQADKLFRKLDDERIRASLVAGHGRRARGARRGAAETQSQSSGTRRLRACPRTGATCSASSS